MAQSSAPPVSGLAFIEVVRAHMRRMFRWPARASEALEKGGGLVTGQEFTRQLEMAVNVIAYALTQEGSITQGLMQTVD